MRTEFPATDAPYVPLDRDFVSDGLSLIGHAFSEKQAWGSKYGIPFENDVFKMHNFCWCDGEECPYCGEEDAPLFTFKPTGATAKWYKYIGRDIEVEGDLPLNFAEICLTSHPSAPKPQQVVLSISEEIEASLKELERAIEAGELDDPFGDEDMIEG